MSGYALTTEAQRDLREVRNYIGRRDSRRAAARVLRTIAKKLVDLAENPGLGHRREDLTTRDDVRFWPVFSYYIIYRVDTDPLEIIGIPSGSEDVEELLSQ